MFHLGQQYTRRDVGSLLNVTRIGATREGPVFVPEQGLALLFVTLDKEGREEAMQYNDWFEGNLFHWDSQTGQHISSKRIQEIVTGELKTFLFVRIKEKLKGVTQPFSFAGLLGYQSHDVTTSNPVHIIWESFDYDDGIGGPLAEAYRWRPKTAVGLPVTPVRGAPERRSGQGFLASAEARKAVENLAMDTAKAYYGKLYSEVLDVSATRSYDLLCRNAGSLRRVEVKGTQGLPNSVILTANEVRAASEGVPTDLFIVHSIILTDTNGKKDASGGQTAILADWVPDANHLSPLSFMYAVPQKLLT